MSADRVDFWVAISEHVKKRIKKYYQKDSVVVFPPVAVEKIKMSDNLPDDYYVILSRLEPYKKVDLAIKAFNKSNRSLVVIGVGSDENRLKEMANKNIEFLGWQSDKSVYEYLRNTKALIFPGEEDFGVTPVEAMACGRPVVAFNVGGVNETVINGKTGLFFDEETPESINIAIEKFEKNYSSYTSANCRSQAEKFSTEKFRIQFKNLVESEYEKYIDNI